MLKNYKNSLGDIRFWIVLFFCIRLIGITNPPLEIAHSWRQSLTNMIARNFLQFDSNIMYPRIDMGGNLTGIIASEFPLFSYLIYIVSELFGYEHWYGRLINLCVASIATFYFYKLVEKLIDKRTAFASALLLICSIWFAYSRKSMPDVFSVSLTIIGVYNGVNYFLTKQRLYLVLYFLFATLGVLCKIPAACLLAIFSVFYFNTAIDFKTKIVFSSVSAAVISIVVAWYFYWDPYLLNKYKYQLYFPQSISQGLQGLASHISNTFEKFYFSATASFVYTVLYVGGIVLLFIKRERRVIYIFLSVSIVFLFFMVKAGSVFSLHSYYIIPYVPIIAMLGGYALGKVKSMNVILLILIAISAESIANQQHDFFIKDSEMYKLQLESIADSVSTRDDLIAINGGDSPQQLYFANRRGWTIKQEELSDLAFVNSLKNSGCKFVFINKKNANAYIIDYEEPVFENEYFKVIKL